MLRDPTGRKILQEKPLVTEKTIPKASLKNLHPLTFGRAYLNFLEIHDFSPNEREKVRFIDDPELAYVMQRYREVKQTNKQTKNCKREKELFFSSSSSFYHKNGGYIVISMVKTEKYSNFKKLFGLGLKKNR